MLFSPSLACANPLALGRDVDALIDNGIEIIHFDIMDGHYVNNFALSPDLLKTFVAAYPKLTIDVHMMVTNPLNYIDVLANAGADWITFHQQTDDSITDIIKAIHSKGLKAGIALSPDESIDSITPYLPLVDLILFMGIRPGIAGRPLLEGSFERIAELDRLRRENNWPYLICIDGGVNDQVAAQLESVGIDIMVLGYLSVFGQPDGISGALGRLRKVLKG